MVTDSLVDHSMLFTHLYFMLREKIEAWLLSPASREYFGVESTVSLLASKFSNLSSAHWYIRWTAKYVFFISEAIKIAVSFSKFQCLYVMLFLWDNLKHGFSVCLKTSKYK